MTAQESLQKLKEGNDRHIKGSYIHPNHSIDRRKELSQGQNPFAVVIACADSRVTPEIIFDQGLGDLFVIRNAGNVADSNVVASVEYAVAHLKTPLVVIMGHQDCGAVKAAMQNAEDSESIKKLVTLIRPAVEKADQQHGPPLESAIKNNLKIVMETLKDSSSILSEKSASNEVRIVSAFYDFDTGRVDFLD